MMTTMKLAALSCLGLALALPATAQTLRADIPFDFQVDNRGLPAGHYVVSVDIPSHRVSLTDYRGQYSNSVFLTTASPSANRGKCTLTFHKYGEQYFLREVKTLDSAVTMPVSKSEKYVKRAAMENRGPKMALVRVAVQ